MNVNRHNFAEKYEEIKGKIESCDFMSFDEEMTGINSADPASRNRRDDTPDERYLRMRPIATKYSIIQFGLCLFHKKQGEGETGYVASPYNFYLFPNNGPDVVLSTSAISFLRQHKMDFGEWMSSGVTFVDKAGEEWLQKRFLEPKPAIQPTDMITLTKQSDVDFLERSRSNLAEFLSDDTRTEFTFEFCNAYLRRVLYQQLEFHHGDSLSASTKENRVVVVKVPAAQREEMKRLKDEENLAKFRAEMGFRLIFNDMVRVKKPIVGHNNFFDLLFLMRWLEGELDDTFQNFKFHLNSLFPLVFDTKHLSSNGCMGEVIADTSLEQLYQYVTTEYSRCMEVDALVTDLTPTTSASDHAASSSTSSSSSEKEVEGSAAAVSSPLTVKSFAAVEVAFAEGMDAYSAGEHYHDAGWDAYCTGVIFANQLRLLEHSVDSAAITVNRNKLFMMQSLYTIDLDVEAASSGILRVGGVVTWISFPESTTGPNILALFESSGFATSELELIWIDGVSAFVCVSEKASASASASVGGDSGSTSTSGGGGVAVVSALKERIADGWTVKSYEDYLHDRLHPAEVVGDESHENTQVSLLSIEKA